MHNYKPENVLILGSNSFGGACTVDRMLSDGCNVLGASRSGEPKAMFLPYKNNENINNFSFHQIDINNDFEKLSALIEKFQPDTVLDFAGQGMVAPSWLTPEQWYQTNIVAKVKLHNVLKDLNCLKRYLRVSTPEVFGDQDQDITEDLHFAPSTPYAVSHAAIDLSLNAFYKHHDFPCIITRFANFYGSGQQLYRILPRALIAALSGDVLPLHGGGHSIRSFIAGVDVADGICNSLMYGKIGESYHFSTKEFISIRELVEKVAQVTGVNFDSFVEIVADRPAKDKAYVMRVDKAERELDWRPQIDLETGIEQTMLWVEKNITEMKQMTKEYIHKP